MARQRRQEQWTDETLFQQTLTILLRLFGNVHAWQSGGDASKQLEQKHQFIRMKCVIVSSEDLFDIVTSFGTGLNEQHI